MTKHKPESTVLLLGILVAGMYITPILFTESTETVKETKEAPTWSELLDTSDVELDLHIDTVDTVYSDTSDSVKDIEIDTNRWAPEYAVHLSLIHI